MRQECARGRKGGGREEQEEVGTMSDTAKVTEATIMKGELITPARQYYY